MSKASVTTQEIQDAVFKRIMSRHYNVGDRLPSVRDLAKELGANRNTVNRAYQMLVDVGVLEIASGRKGFQVKPFNTSVHPSGEQLKHYFFAQAKELIWQGFASGFSHKEVSEQLSQALEEVYKLGHLTIAFFECNPQDSKDMGIYLSQMLKRDIYCGLLGELESDAIENYDLIITTFHHLSSVMQGSKHYADKVVGIDTRLTPDTLLEIARLPKGRIGIVCTLASTAQMLQHILYSYYPERDIKAITIDEVAAIKQLQNVDHLLVTHTCVNEVKQLSKRMPDVVIHFQIDQQSIQFLDKRIQMLQLEKTQAVQPNSAVLSITSQAN